MLLWDSLRSESTVQYGACAVDIDDLAIRAATVMLETPSVVSPVPVSIWTKVLAGDPEAVVDQTPKWTSALTNGGRWHDCSRLYEFDDGRRFVLPLVRRVETKLAPQSGFAPSWGIGGLVGAGLDASVVSKVCQDLASFGSLSVHVRPNPTQAKLWEEAGPRFGSAISRRAHVLALDGARDELFAGLSASTRRRVRKAERGSLEIGSYVGGDQLDTYYDELYLPSLERWGEAQNEPAFLARLRGQRRDPRSKLKALAKGLGESFVLTLALVDGRPAAGNIVLVGPNAHYTRGAMNEVGASSGASHAAMWHAIAAAKERDASWFHMGESGTNPGLASFKERFGAVAHDYCEYRFERFPFLAIDTAMRSGVKRVLRFKDS